MRDREALLRDCYRAFNERAPDWHDVWRASMADEIVLHLSTLTPDAPNVHGPDSVIAHVEELFEVWPGLRCEVTEMATEGDEVAVRAVLSARPHGSSERISAEIRQLWRFDGDKVVEASWRYASEPEAAS